VKRRRGWLTSKAWVDEGVLPIRARLRITFTHRPGHRLPLHGRARTCVQALRPPQGFTFADRSLQGLWPWTGLWRCLWTPVSAAILPKPLLNRPSGPLQGSGHSSKSFIFSPSIYGSTKFLYSS
jgi:hypothetical protein